MKEIVDILAMVLVFGGVCIAFILFAVVWIISHKFWIALLYILLTFATAFLVHYYRIWCHRLMTFFRAMHLRKTEVYQKLCQLNRQIVGTMEGILH